MNTVEEGKTHAIISYLTFIGAIIALILNNERKNDFASFHIRQALGLICLFIALGYPVGYFDSWMVSSAFYLFFFILWIYGFIGAVSGQKNLIPVLGPLFQKVFKSL
ncbi:DUF4870 domain-containing protein [Flavobacterium rhizosphaerae]|uniref:Chloroplast import component protein (Tic20) n=1 Tax=Flavobacterium rhizosphaerae TaxID=3163298 RepID=A0ABW8YSN2_9FLAO